MARITVAVNGALGRMGSTVLGALEAEPELEPVGAADVAAESGTLRLPGGAEVTLARDLETLLGSTKPDVVVDFTNAEAARRAIEACLRHGVRVVSGSTGLSERDLADIRALADKAGLGVISAANFALGAVLLMHLARIAARHFDYADLIESHHEAKVDAPSGTALAIVRAMADGKGGEFRHAVPRTETLAGTRGGALAGINVHSARLPGRVARHEVVFGAPGQTLTLIHDSISRESFMPGVMLACKQVIRETGLVVGLEAVLGLERAKR